LKDDNLEDHLEGNLENKLEDGLIEAYSRIVLWHGYAVPQTPWPPQ
jgi:hypothetical protein